MTRKISTWDIIIILSPLLVLIIYKFFNYLGIETICPYKLITNHNCPGCGITRAIICVLKGNFSQAINHNPLVVVVFPLLVYIWVKFILKCKN